MRATCTADILAHLLCCRAHCSHQGHSAGILHDFLSLRHFHNTVELRYMLPHEMCRLSWNVALLRSSVKWRIMHGDQQGTSVRVALCTRLCMHTLRHRRLLPQLGLLLLTQPAHAASGPPPGPSDAPPSCSGCPHSGAHFPVPCCRHLLRRFSETVSEAKDCMGKAVAWTLIWQAAPQSALG